jgi:hypothetical protein
MEELFITYLPVGAVMWLVLQVAALRTLDGRWRNAALLPIYAMGAAFIRGLSWLVSRSA